MDERKPVRSPRIARWLLCRMSIYDIKYASIGDFEEEYHKIIRNRVSSGHGCGTGLRYSARYRLIILS